MAYFHAEKHLCQDKWRDLRNAAAFGTDVLELVYARQRSNLSSETDKLYHSAMAAVSAVNTQEMNKYEEMARARAFAIGIRINRVLSDYALMTVLSYQLQVLLHAAFSRGKTAAAEATEPLLGVIEMAVQHGEVLPEEVVAIEGKWRAIDLAGSRLTADLMDAFVVIWITGDHVSAKRLLKEVL